MEVFPLSHKVEILSVGTELLLGSIANTQVSLNTVDIGLAQLAMHSPYETCGSGDTEDLVALARALFSASLEETGSDGWAVR